VQLAPTASPVPQLFANTNEDASAPVTAMLLIVSAAVPLFVTVTDCDPLEEPTASVPYDRLLAESVTGAVGAVPVPLNAIVCGDVTALSVTVIAAVNAPGFIGSK